MMWAETSRPRNVLESLAIEWSNSIAALVCHSFMHFEIVKRKCCHSLSSSNMLQNTGFESNSYLGRPSVSFVALCRTMHFSSRIFYISVSPPVKKSSPVTPLSVLQNEYIFSFGNEIQ
jgi:hypothetical protein